MPRHARATFDLARSTTSDPNVTRGLTHALPHVSGMGDTLPVIGYPRYRQESSLIDELGQAGQQLQAELEAFDAEGHRQASRAAATALAHELIERYPPRALALSSEAQRETPPR